MSSAVLIELNDVTKEFNSGNEVIHAIKDLNLKIFKGEFVVIMGPSGSGKTTFLNLLAGFLKPTKGSIKLNNKQIEILSDNAISKLRQFDIGFIFQFYNLHDGLTAQENVELPLLISQTIKKSKDRKLKAKELLKLVDLENKVDNFVNELSGGQRQRVGIARALANDPPIILADEPTGDLDSETASEIIDLLYQENITLQKTFVVVTHDKNILREGMRVIQMKDGSIEEDSVYSIKNFKEEEITEPNIF